MMGPIEALERSRVVAIRRRLMAPKVAKEATQPRQDVRRYAPSLPPEPPLPPVAPTIQAVVDPMPNLPELPAKPVAPKTPKVPVALDPKVPLETRREAIRRIIGECAAKHRVLVSDLIGTDKSRHTVHARHEAIFRLHVELNMSHAAVGLVLGKNESTTKSGFVAHAGRSRAAAEIARQHAQKIKAQMDHERQLAVAAYTLGEINFTQVVSLMRMTKTKARRLLSERGIIVENGVIVEQLSTDFP